MAVAFQNPHHDETGLVAGVVVREVGEARVKAREERGERDIRPLPLDTTGFPIQFKIEPTLHNSLRPWCPLPRPSYPKGI